MPDTHDDLDAIRAIVDALTPFEQDEQTRIIRWAFEKLNISLGTLGFAPSHTSPTNFPAVSIQAPTQTVAPPAGTEAVNLDIKSFVKAKAPSSDMQFAATIAYFYTFEALDEHKKQEIGSDDLQEACRLTGRERLTNPGQTLRNAAFNGLLDKGSEKSTYKINTVGENLVALTLPSGSSNSGSTPKKKRSRKSAPAKKVPKKAVTKAAKKAAEKTRSKN